MVQVAWLSFYFANTRTWVQSLKSIPPPPKKNKKHLKPNVVAHASNPCSGKVGNRQLPGAPGPASLAYWLSSKPVRRMIPKVILWSPDALLYVWIHNRHTHRHTRNQICDLRDLHWCGCWKCQVSQHQAWERTWLHTVSHVCKSVPGRM